jgi:ribonucleotide reductase, class II
MNAQVQALADYTFVSKYAKYLPELTRRETWQECIDRSKNMHRVKYAGMMDRLETYLDEAFTAYMNKICVGSQRNLQFAGDAVFSHNARSYNCCGSYVDRLRFFQEAMYNLLCGTGVGFSVQKHHVAKLPPLDLREKTEIVSYEIPDSIEGWAESIGVLVSSYFQDSIYPEYQGKVVKFIYKNIREKGSTFSHGIGKAPGPDPLRNTHEKIRKLLDECVAAGQTRIKPINAYDIVMHSSDAVLSGGIRRSATICIFSVDDEEMMNAKTGNWFVDNPQRGRSNNSALLIKNSTTPEQFRRLMDSTKQFGEPGFYWSDSTEMIPNPCMPDSNWIMTDVGPRQIKDLIGKQFNAVVNGKVYASTFQGFYETGYQNVYTIKTLEGYEVRATHNHQFLTSNGEWKTIDQLQSGDVLCINNHNTNIEWNGQLNFEQGWLLGNLIGDGFIGKDSAYLDYWNVNANEMKQIALNYLKVNQLAGSHVEGYSQTATVEKYRVESIKLKQLAESYGVVNGSKDLNESIELLGSDAYAGFLRGYFDADGSVQGNSQNGASIRLSSVNLNNLKIVQRMLLRLGIYSKIYNNRRSAGERKIKGKFYACQACHELVISRDMINMYREIVGFNDSNKRDSLDNIIASRSREAYASRFEATVSEIVCGAQEKVYDCTIENVHAFDANGFYSHNCVEIGFYCYDDQGRSGWQFCNLSTINGSKVRTAADFRNAARCATIIGTLQAGYTDFPYLGEVTQNIVRREALLGVSITGMMENPKILLNSELQREVAASLTAINREVAAIIGINPAARITCIKPEGSTSCMLGTSSGIHPHHAKRYIRRVQANKMEGPAQHYADLNPRAVEESSWSANNTDVCISFACEVSSNAIFKDQVNAIEMLENVKNTQINWVSSGCNKDLGTQPWLSHNVSNTVVVKPEEWDAVEQYIYDNREYFAGVSLIGSSGDKDYTQAPFTEVFTPAEIVDIYGNASLFASGIIEEAMFIYGDLWKACATALGYGEDLSEKKLLEHEELRRQAKLDWIARVKKFAKKYYASDVKRVTYLLKDVYNWKLWIDVSKEHKKVDYTELHETVNTTNGTQEIACAGGVCLI